MRRASKGDMSIWETSADLGMGTFRLGSEDGEKEGKNTLQSCLLKSLVTQFSDLHLYNLWSQQCPPPPLPGPDQCLALQLQDPQHRSLLCRVRDLCVCSPLRTHHAHMNVTCPDTSCSLNSPRAFEAWRARKGILAMKSKKVERKNRILSHQGYRDLAQRGDVTSPRS